MPDLPSWFWIAAALAAAPLAALFIKGWTSWSTVAEGACRVDHDEWEEWAGVCPHTYDDQYAIRRRTVVSFPGGKTYAFHRSFDIPWNVGPMRLERNWWGRHRLIVFTKDGIWKRTP